MDSSRSNENSSTSDNARDRPTPTPSFPTGSLASSAHRSSAPSRDARMRESVTSPPVGDSQTPSSPGGYHTDRVFPIRSAVSVDPTPTPGTRASAGDYFPTSAHARRFSASTTESPQTQPAPVRHRNASIDPAGVPEGSSDRRTSDLPLPPAPLQRSAASQLVHDISTTRSEGSTSDHGISDPRERHHNRAPSATSGAESLDDLGGGLVTARFKHVVQDGGHLIITGRAGETLQRCEDEPIHIPGAVQGFGMLIALAEDTDGKLVVRVVSENSRRMMGYTPKQLFALDSFTDILTEEQADNLLDHIDFIRDEDADVAVNGPEVFTMTIRTSNRRARKFWCAIHINERNPDLVICEFELEDDPDNPLVAINEQTPDLPEDTLGSEPTPEELAESTQNMSKPLRVLRSARKRKGEAAAMEVFNIMSQVQEQLAAAPNLDKFLKVLVGVVKELTGFHRVMVYQFDQSFNGKVVTELVDPRATRDLYKGLNFPASDIPKQARDLYKINKVRLLYDRDQETARLVCRTAEDLETPLDLTHSYLRAMSPIHIKYLANMAVRSSMSISINAFEELWGLISCHTYGQNGVRVAFPIRKMCRLIGDSASRNIERLSYASRLQARKLINTVPTQHNPSGYIIASSEDLLKLFDADFGLLSIRDETKILGHLEHSQEALAMLEYMRMRKITSVTTSMDIRSDFPDLRYQPGFQVIAGLLLVPLSVGGNDFIVFFRKGQLKEVKWAGNPYEKFIKEGTEGYLEPRKSFKQWNEMVVGKCREWTEEEIETAAVLCLVYGKFIEVWRQKEAALQNSQLTKLLLANSAHEVRTPLNAIINYLEIALEGSIDQETRENLAKSHSASKSLIYVINDLLDLTKTEQGGELIKGEVFELKSTLFEATDMFKGDARRKNLHYTVVEHTGLPEKVIGDQRKIRQCISNLTANAIQNTAEGGVSVEMSLMSHEQGRVDIEVTVEDTGSGMSSSTLDALFRDLEQVQSIESDQMVEDSLLGEDRSLTDGTEKGKRSGPNRTLGLGLAVVARIIRNMDGQLRLKSEEGVGSRFVLQFPFDLPDSEPRINVVPSANESEDTTGGTVTPLRASSSHDLRNTSEVTLVERSSLYHRSPSSGSERNSRSQSIDSLHSKKSLKSMKSTSSAHSGKSDVDRLIEAIQEPHVLDRPNVRRSGSSLSTTGVKRLSYEAIPTSSSTGDLTKPRSDSLDESAKLQAAAPSTPGQHKVIDQREPIRAVRMPDEFLPSASTDNAGKHKIEDVTDESAQPHPVLEPGKQMSTPQGLDEAGGDSARTLNADHLNVLVAEDDPVNSRIVKKRLEKLGHVVSLTVNGEECSTMYGDRPGRFDVVLMDMQMPIVDGLTSTKMIRSYEKSHPQHILSERASLNGRVPIIAVSASLVEKNVQQYLDAGFDAWILKPISFSRLNELMQGIVDPVGRRQNLYRPGPDNWERGGWFSEAQPTVFDARTAPSKQTPQEYFGPSATLAQQAASTTDSEAGDDRSDYSSVAGANRQQQQQHQKETTPVHQPEQAET